MTLKRATKNKIHLALHLLLCSLWERKRQKEKVRDWQSGSSLNAEKSEDFEEQVVILGVPHLPGLAANLGSDQPPWPVSGLYWHDHSQLLTCSHMSVSHWRVCAHLKEECWKGSEFRLMIDLRSDRRASLSAITGSLELFPGNAWMFLYRDSFISTTCWKVKIMTCSPKSFECCFLAKVKLKLLTML